MKVLHLSTSDYSGGAARGAYWMHKALQQANVNSMMLVAEKSTADPSVIGSPGITGAQKIVNGIRQTVEYWPLKRYKQKQPGFFSSAIFPSKLVKQVRDIDPDIINLHWVSMGLLRPEYLRQFGKPIVWTLRDMWGFTGGCHYAGACRRYEQQCGCCPLLGSAQESDLSRQTWQRKYRAWEQLPMTLVPISHWLADCARQSSLFKSKQIEVIPNAVDPEQYYPINKKVARDLLKLPQDKKLILFGAISPTADKRKGFTYLAAALRQLSQCDRWQTQAEAVIFGTDRPARPLNLGLNTAFLGRLHDDTMLALAYSAADVMVVPSIQEAFGKTSIEAMACGTPVVSFDSTGLKDSVVHRQNGYRAQCFCSDDLAAGIMWVLEDDARWATLSRCARSTVTAQFTFKRQAQRYQAVYLRLLNQAAAHSAD
ncbi:MAG: glycosyltransferase [Leptolyngbya sp. SIO4C1]|nr:glycosyltransferase [Leptolyngbya sp. SIO4C1]